LAFKSQVSWEKQSRNKNYCTSGSFCRCCLTNFLGEELLDVIGAQGAAITDLAQLGVLDHLADLGGGGELELGRLDGDIVIEEGQDDIILTPGLGSGGQVADQTAVALSGFRGQQNGEGGISLILGWTTSTTAGPTALGRKDGSSQNETLEEDDSSQETKGGSGSTGKGNSSSGCSNSGSAEDEGSLSEVGGSHEGKRSNDESVHAVNDKINS
jgi:hypothetical protein